MASNKLKIIHKMANYEKVLVETLVDWENLIELCRVIIAAERNLLDYPLEENYLYFTSTHLFAKNIEGPPEICININHPERETGVMSDCSHIKFIKDPDRKRISFNDIEEEIDMIKSVEKI